MFLLLYYFTIYDNINFKKGGFMKKTKICNRCGEEKPVTEFYKNYLYKDCLLPTCKKCLNEMKKAQYHKRKEESSNGKKIY